MIRCIAALRSAAGAPGGRWIPAYERRGKSGPLTPAPGEFWDLAVTMFKRLFRKDPALEAGESLFAAASDQSRAPAFYEAMGVPDTVEGRFEMTALHVWLILRKLKGGDRAARNVAQKLFDVMFASFDDALRELGVGDLIVGKKIRKMAESFYGRVQAYDAAIENAAGGDNEMTLAAALARNVYESSDPEIAARLVDYVRAAAQAIDNQPQVNVVRGVVSFSEVGS